MIFGTKSKSYENESTTDTDDVLTLPRPRPRRGGLLAHDGRTRGDLIDMDRHHTSHRLADI